MKINKQKLLAEEYHRIRMIALRLSSFLIVYMRNEPKIDHIISYDDAVEQTKNTNEFIRFELVERDGKKYLKAKISRVSNENTPTPTILRPDNSSEQSKSP